MRKIALDRVQADLGAYIEQCRVKGPLLITRRGKPIGVLSATGSLTGSTSRRTRKKTLDEVLQEREADVAAGRGFPMEEAWKMVGKRHAEKTAKSDGKRGKHR
jgi:hypothetical protein